MTTEDAIAAALRQERIAPMTTTEVLPTVAQYDSAFATLSKSALGTKQERDRLEAMLRKIAGWQRYRGSEHAPLTEYEEGANDMLATLKAMAEEVLS